MPSAQELIDSCDTLFSLPEIYLRVREVVDDPASSTDDLAKVLLLDPALTAKILQVVNSPLYRLPRKVGTLTQAVSLLGMHPIQDIVLTTSVAKAFPKMQATLMNMTDYWRQSVRCGLLAGGLAKHVRQPNAEEYFVVGLLRDVGHLVLYQTVPDRAQAALVEAAHLFQPVAAVERESIGCDFAEVGAELMRRWGMPHHFESSIRYQVEPTEAGTSAPGATVLHASGILSDELEGENVAMEEVLSSQRTTPSLRRLHCEPDQARPIVTMAQTSLHEVLAMIYPRPAALAA